MSCVELRAFFACLPPLPCFLALQFRPNWV